MPATLPSEEDAESAGGFPCLGLADRAEGRRPNCAFFKLSDDYVVITYYGSVLLQVLGIQQETNKIPALVTFQAGE